MSFFKHVDGMFLHVMCRQEVPEGMSYVTFFDYTRPGEHPNVAGARNPADAGTWDISSFFPGSDAAEEYQEITQEEAMAIVASRATCRVEGLPSRDPRAGEVFEVVSSDQWTVFTGLRVLSWS